MDAEPQAQSADRLRLVQTDVVASVATSFDGPVGEDLLLFLPASDANRLI